MEFLDVLLMAMQDAAIRDEVLGYTDLLNGPLEGREPVAARHERRVIERVHQVVNDTAARVARGELAVPPHYLFCNHRPRRVARARSTVSPHGARP
jgi:hypothetical protein